MVLWCDRRDDPARRRSRSGAADGHMAEGGHDLYGMYRDWVTSERHGGWDEKITAGGTASFYHHNKWLYLWLPERENIPGRIEICLRARPELLFLSGSICFLSDRRASGAAESAGVSDTFWGARIFLSVRKPFGTVRLRMAVSFRTGSGSFA